MWSSLLWHGDDGYNESSTYIKQFCTDWHFLLNKWLKQCCCCSVEQLSRLRLSPWQLVSHYIKGGKSVRVLPYLSVVVEIVRVCRTSIIWFTYYKCVFSELSLYFLQKLDWVIALQWLQENVALLPVVSTVSPVRLEKCQPLHLFYLSTFSVSTFLCFLGGYGLIIKFVFIYSSLK